MRKIETLTRFKSKKAGIAILLIMYVLMGVGYTSVLSEWFVFLTPVMLFITAGMLWIDSKANNTLGWPIAVLIIVLGYGIEILGVHSPALLGSYSYGEMLGWKFFGVPPIIGVQWLILVWGGFSMVTPFEFAPVVKWLFTALIATGLFWIIEPVASHFHLVEQSQIPASVQNYAVRFVILVLFAAIFEKYPLVSKPRMGQTALICQFLFFVWLRIKMS